MFNPARHTLILTKAEEVFNALPIQGRYTVLAAYDMYEKTMGRPTVRRQHRVAIQERFCTCYTNFMEYKTFTDNSVYTDGDAEVLTDAEWWFIYLNACKHHTSYCDNKALKPSCLKHYLAHIRAILTNKRQSKPGRTTGFVLGRVATAFYNNNTIVIPSIPFRMAMNTALSLVVEGWSSQFDTYNSVCGVKHALAMESHTAMIKDIVDIHVDQKIALPDAIGIAVTAHRAALEATLKELLANPDV